jgi:hypothetical protein
LVFLFSTLRYGKKNFIILAESNKKGCYTIYIP